MNWFFNPCRRYRRDVGLLAGGVLSEIDGRSVKDHLGKCAHCREYYDQVRSVTIPFANLAGGLAQQEPSEAARQRWARAIQSVADHERSAAHYAAGIWQPLALVAAFREWVRGVIWPYRRIWTGLAAVWLMIFAGNLSLRDHPQSLAGKSSPPAQEIMMALRDRQTTLAELLTERAVPREADRQERVLPKPRTERGRMGMA